MTDDHLTGDHHSPDLVGLVAGELGRSQLIDAGRHLHLCSGCTDELVDLIIAHSALRACARTRQALAATPGMATDAPLSALPSLPARRWPHGHARRWWLAASAAVVAATLLVAILTGIQGPRSGRAVLVRTALRPIDAPAFATGSMTLVADGTARWLTVRTSGLPPPRRSTFYEVWLFDPSTSKMLPMGVLPPGGRGAYAVRADIMAGYSAVDVSLQADNGDPAHSRTSVLRATY